MPQIVAAAVAQSAMAAPVVAPTLAGAGTAAATAGTTAALEASKQAIISESMKQAGLEATKQAGIEAGKQAGIEAGKQAAQQGIMQGADDAANLARAQQYLSRNPTASLETILPSGPPVGGPPPGGTPFTSSTPAAPAPPAAPPAPAAPVAPAGTPAGLQSAYPGSVPPTPTVPAPPTQPIPPLGSQTSAVTEAIRSAPNVNPADYASNQLNRSIAEKTFAEYSKSPLEKGFDSALKYVKNMDPLQAGLGLMSVGQYLNQPEEPEKKKYKNTVDMSGFEPSLPSPQPFTPSYQYQGYAVGGPVETMSAQNAVGNNMMYPQAGLQTALYSNPMVQRPEAVNVIAPSGEPAVGAYSGEARFAEGGISDEVAKEYGLKTRKQRALKGLTSTYDEMQKEREKELAGLKTMGDKFDEGIIPRSRTQQLTSPYSAAIAEHTRLAKKNKVPVAEMPKTSLGDIDTYMDTPLEAAKGGIMHGLGGYSDGGRLLRGPGDGVSDSIPAVIGKRQPARLADGEFVIPARIVSELGNGSTEAGARKLYAMMERVQNARKKSIGKKKVAVNSKADKHLPA